MSFDKEVKLTLVGVGCLVVVVVVVVVVFALGLMYKRNLDLQDEVHYLKGDGCGATFIMPDIEYDGFSVEKAKEILTEHWNSRA